MRLHWIAACMLGEALGVAGVSTTYAAIDRGILSPPAIWILGAGVWEGLCLGGAQAFVLRRIGVSQPYWIAMTVVGAVAGYALSLIGGAQESSDFVASVWVVCIFGAGVGVITGLILGGVQWFALRGLIALRPWLVANAIGWAPAMAILMFAAGSVERTWPFYVTPVVGAGAGALAGLCVGGVTAVVVQRAERIDS